MCYFSFRIKQEACFHFFVLFLTNMVRLLFKKYISLIYIFISELCLLVITLTPVNRTRQFWQMYNLMLGLLVRGL